MKTIGAIMREKREVREKENEARREASMSPEQRRKMAEYYAKVRQPAAMNADTRQLAESRFTELTGLSVRESGQVSAELFGRIHAFLSRQEQQGFFMVGGTGCGKTTMAKTFAVTGGYTVVSCLSVVHEYEHDKRSIDRFRSGSICFDDLGAEPKAYGNEVMADIIQSRYDLWRSQVVRLRRYEIQLERAVAMLKNHGFTLESFDYDKWMALNKKDPLAGDMVGKTQSFAKQLVDDIRTIRQGIIRTHITSNLDYQGVAERYGERVSSRLQEMCRVVSFGNEKDQRIIINK